MDGRFSPNLVSPLGTRASSTSSYPRSPSISRIREKMNLSSPERKASSDILLEDTKKIIREKSDELSEEVESRMVALARKERRFLEEKEELRKKMDDLRDRLTYTEEQLASARTEKAKLERRLEQLESELSIARERLDTSTSLYREKVREAADLAEKIVSLEREKEETLNKSQSELLQSQRDLDSYKQTIDTLNKHIKAQAEEIRYLQELNNRTQERIESLADQERNAELTALELKKAKEEARENARLEERCERLERQLRQLRNDNARLTKMLQSTNQFSSFLQYASESDGVAYVPPVSEHSAAAMSPSRTPGSPSRRPAASPSGPRHSRAEDEIDQLFDDVFNGGLSHTYGSGTYLSVNGDGRPVMPESEWKYWIPEEAFAVANEFKHKYLPHTHAEIFSKLLVKLNQVWRKRELRKIAALKARFREQLAALKRRWSQQRRYDDVLAGEKIEFLKRELKKAHRGGQQNRNGKSEIETTMLESTLVTVENLSRQLAELKEENKALRADLEATNGEKHLTSAQRDRAFMEGAAWMGQKMVAVTEKLNIRVGALVLELQQRALGLKAKATSASAAAEAGDTANMSAISMTASAEEVRQAFLRLQSGFRERLEQYFVTAKDRMRQYLERVLEAMEHGEAKRTVQVELADEETDELI